MLVGTGRNGGAEQEKGSGGSLTALFHAAQSKR